MLVVDTMPLSAAALGPAWGAALDLLHDAVEFLFEAADFPGRKNAPRQIIALFVVKLARFAFHCKFSWSGDLKKIHY